MNFDKPEQVEMICYDIRLGDYPRGLNRARINNLFNGAPPFEDDEANKVNVNPLTGTKIAHDARAQFYAAFLKPAKYFDARTDSGPRHKRNLYSSIVTHDMNKIMKKSMTYYETFRSKFALDVLHGIGPGVWRNQDKWCPDALGIDDIGIPANTLLTMENLPFFYIYRSYTAPELRRLTRGDKNPGWNMPLVDRCIEWIDAETTALMGTRWPEVWSPEKTSERVKSDGGFYASDQVPTIDCFDFYFLDEEGSESGWKRRIILDSWSTPQYVGGKPSMSNDKRKEWAAGQFLFDSGKRIYSRELSQVMSFQFADLSSVAPFRYHSVRSLGFLTYAVCHLQNRLYCRFSEATFEALMNYFRVKSSDDAERALKIELANRGFIDESVQFIPQSERWQVNANFIELGMNENRRILETHASAYTQQQTNTPGDRKTKFQVMAEASQTAALVSSALNQAYQYQEFEYREIFRRFCKNNSTDPQVRDFRARILRKGVPASALDPESWEIEPNRVMGAGNKTMEMAISEQLMQMRPLYDPEPQREILRKVTLAITDDADLALALVPEQPLKISDSVHDAQLAMGSLMQGLPVALKTGQNHKEYIMVMLKELEMLIMKYENGQGMAPPEKIEGFQNVAMHVAEHLKVLDQDQNEKQFVAAANKELAKLMNYVKAFAQRLEEQMKKQQAQGPKQDPQAQAKVQATIMQAQTKAKVKQEEHSHKLAQKNMEFQLEEKRKDAALAREERRKDQQARAENERQSLKSVGDE
jgi:hypothetical protein